MAATTTRIASADFVLAERKCAHDLSLQEFAEMNFPAINHLEWLNCHLSELLASSQLYVTVHLRVVVDTNSL